jgi:hypothetical protein
MARILRLGFGRRECFGVIVAAIWIRRLAETNSIRPQIRFYFLICLTFLTCHSPLFAGNMPP